MKKTLVAALFAGLVPSSHGYDIYHEPTPKCAEGHEGEGCDVASGGANSRESAALQAKNPANYHNCNDCRDAGFGWCPNANRCGHYWNRWCPGDAPPVVAEEVKEVYEQKKGQGCYWQAYAAAQDYVIMEKPGGARWTVKDCADECNKLGNKCTGFEYPLDGTYCAPWFNQACSTTGSPGFHNGQGFDLFVRKNLPSPPPAPAAPTGFHVVKGTACGWCIRGHEYREGTDYSIWYANRGERMTPEVCASICRRTDGCTGFEMPHCGRYCAPWYDGKCSSQETAGVTWRHNRHTIGFIDLYVLSEMPDLVKEEPPQLTAVAPKQCGWVDDAQCACGPCRRGLMMQWAGVDFDSKEVMNKMTRDCHNACERNHHCEFAQFRVDRDAKSAACFYKSHCGNPHRAATRQERNRTPPQWLLYAKCHGSGAYQELYESTPVPAPVTMRPTAETVVPVPSPEPTKVTPVVKKQLKTEEPVEDPRAIVKHSNIDLIIEPKPAGIEEESNQKLNLSPIRICSAVLAIFSLGLMGLLIKRCCCLKSGKAVAPGKDDFSPTKEEPLCLDDSVMGVVVEGSPEKGSAVLETLPLHEEDYTGVSIEEEDVQN